MIVFIQIYSDAQIPLIRLPFGKPSGISAKSGKAMTEGVVALVVVLTFTGNLYTIIIRIFTGGKQMTTISTLAEYINCIEKFDSVFVFRFEDNHYDDIWDLENNNSQEVQKLKNSKYQKAQNVYNYLRNKDLYNDNLTGSERQRLISSVREEVLEARDELYAQAFYKRFYFTEF